MTTPTGVLSDEFRRKWCAASATGVDTFDGARDTQERDAWTGFQLGRYHAWIVDEWEILSSVQWKRLFRMHLENPPVFILLAGDTSQFPPIEDDGGVASRQFPATTIHLTAEFEVRPRQSIWSCLQSLEELSS